MEKIKACQGQTLQLIPNIIVEQRPKKLMLPLCPGRVRVGHAPHQRQAGGLRLARRAPGASHPPVEEDDHPNQRERERLTPGRARAGYVLTMLPPTKICLLFPGFEMISRKVYYTAWAVTNTLHFDPAA
jgi:hypothetical protein